MATNRPALFASAFHPHVGGVEELVRQLAHEQSVRGGSPLIVTNRYPQTLAPSELVEGLPVLRYPFRVPEPNARQFGGWALYSARTQRSIAQALRQHRADIIHVQCVSSNGRYALAASRSLKLPLVVTLQGELTMDASRVYERSAQLRRNWRVLLGRADVVTACSGYVLEEAEQVLGRSLGDRGRVIYNGIRPQDFERVLPARSGRPFVLGIGRLVPQKGFDLLLQAFALLTEQTHDLVLAGDGPERASLEALAHALGVTDRVRFVGRVDHGQAVDLFLAADVFVLPSRHEPQGIVVLEAMAARTPVVAAAVGGVPEVVEDGRNGLLYRRDDVQHLQQQLTTVMRRPDLARALVAAGLGTAQALSWSHVADQYEECYAIAARR